MVDVQRTTSCQEEEQKKDVTEEERWKQIEFELTYEPTAAEEIVAETLDRLNPNHKIITKIAKEKSAAGLSLEKDFVQYCSLYFMRLICCQHTAAW
eukprot:6015361-Amphidinium_carterae.1